MTLLAPAFALFTALAAVPILLHLFGRPRARRRAFAAMAFLLKSDKRTAPRRRLREWLILAARAASIATVPLILAKPYCEAESALPSGIGAGRAESAVIVLDDSRSMSWSDAGGRSRFEEARLRARALVDGMGRDSEAAILVTTSAPSPQAELSADRNRLRRALAEAQPSHRPGDTTSALRRAAALLATAPQEERRVYLISDLAAHGFGGEAPWSAGGPSLVTIGVGGAGENRAVTELRVEPAPAIGPRALRVDVTVQSYGDQAEHDLPITLRVDGKAVAKGLVDLEPRGRAVKRFFHTLDPPVDAAADKRAPGESAEQRAEPPHDIVAELPADPLVDDDRRFARVQVSRELRVLIVDGDPRTIRRDDEAFFLETALRPGDRDDSRIEVTVATSDELARRTLAEYDVIFVANAKAPDRPRADALAAFVDKGGGLFFGVGDNVDPDAWNAALGDLLPQPLATARTVGATRDARGDGEARQGGEGEKIARFDRRHPVLSPFDGGAARGPAEALREARVQRYLLLKPTSREEGRQVLLRLESGAPLLVESRHGAGRVMLLTTTLDRDWSDLALQPAYLPLLQQAARYLARASLREPEVPSLSGAPREIALREGDQRVEVTLPSGAVRHFDPDRVSGRKSLAFADTEEPGIYRVAATGSAQPPKPRPSAAFAVNVDPSESDLRPIDPAKLAALARPREGQAMRAPRRRVELWHALGAALLALLLLEGALAASDRLRFLRR